jgi:hypothetical protein
MFSIFALKPFTDDNAFPMHKIIKQDEVREEKKKLDAGGQYRTDPRSRFAIGIRIALPPQSALLQLWDRTCKKRADCLDPSIWPFLFRLSLF